MDHIQTIIGTEKKHMKTDVFSFAFIDYEDVKTV